MKPVIPAGALSLCLLKVHIEEGTWTRQHGGGRWQCLWILWQLAHGLHTGRWCDHMELATEKWKNGIRKRIQISLYLSISIYLSISLSMYVCMYVCIVLYCNCNCIVCMYVYMCIYIHIYIPIYIYPYIVPADDMGVVGHTQKTQTPMSSAKWKQTKKCITPVSSVKCLGKILHDIGPLTSPMT